MTQLSLVRLGLLGTCAIVAYYCAKVSYKRVKGNQLNKQWIMAAKEKKKLKESDGIYLNLGTLYESQKD